MSNAAPFAIAGSTTSVADPRSLMLRLEVCRLQAELERLEARVGELRSRSTAEPAPAVDHPDPVGGPIDHLLDRMVGTLLESGRAEIIDATARRHADAEAGLEAARLRAGAAVDAGRADLEAALAERGGALRTAWARGLDEVDLLEQECLSAVAAPPESEPVPAEPVVSEPVVSEPVVSELVASEPALPRTAEKEEARTDAAFDAWMAVGPAAEVSLEHVADALESEGDAGPEPAPSIARTRSRWLLPLEVAAALLVAALLVVLGLVLVG